MPTQLRSSYQIKWFDRLPKTAPAGVSSRNWSIFVDHVQNNRSMYSLAGEHEVTRARVSAIVSRVNQLLIMAEQQETAASALPVFAMSLPEAL